MPNPWITHVKAYQDQHQVSYKEALQLAKATYDKSNIAVPNPVAEQEGGLLGTLAAVGSIAAAADALSKPISQATLKGPKIKPKAGSKRETDTRLIAQQGLISSIPDIIAEDRKRRQAKQASRKK